MSVADTGVVSDKDDALAELQSDVALVFARARTLWREAAAWIHPDLQPSGYKLLADIARCGSANAHRLAERFEMDKSVVSRQTRMLEELGLLESRPDEHDGRIRVLTATQAAREALADVRGKHAQRMRETLTQLSSEEIRTASKVLHLLAEA